MKCKIFFILFIYDIVISSIQEPISGWTDNLNGPIGLLIGISKGVVHVVCSHNSVNPDFIPVDLAVKAMIVAAYHHGINKY